MKKQSKGFGPLTIILAAAVIVIVTTLFLLTQKESLPSSERTGTQKTTQSVPAIQNANDLNTVTSELDNTDLNELDKELNQLDTDVSTF